MFPLGKKSYITDLVAGRSVALRAGAGSLRNLCNGAGVGISMLRQPVERLLHRGRGRPQDLKRGRIYQRHPQMLSPVKRDVQLEVPGNSLPQLSHAKTPCASSRTIIIPLFPAIEIAHQSRNKKAEGGYPCNLPSVALATQCGSGSTSMHKQVMGHEQKSRAGRCPLPARLVGTNFYFAWNRYFPAPT
jgi:hypothetical protein